MSKNFYDIDSFLYHHDHCNSCHKRYNTCNNNNNTSPLKYDKNLLYTLAILIIFGSGSCGSCGFWGDYNKIFTCSGFNNHWCDSSTFDNLDNGNSNNNFIQWRI